MRIVCFEQNSTHTHIYYIICLCLFSLSLPASGQGITYVTVEDIGFHVGNHLYYLAFATYDKALMGCTCSLPKAALRPANALVYQALHLEYLLLFHAFSPSSGLLNFS